MRSDLVFGVQVQVPNRYQLCRLASHATRKLHKPNDRIQDTVNDVLILFRKASPVAEACVVPKPTAGRAGSRVRLVRTVAPPIEHPDLTLVALNHAVLSPERIGA